MNWTPMLNKIARQPLNNVNGQPVHAILNMPDGSTAQVHLELKLDRLGRPYLVLDRKYQLRYLKQQQHAYGVRPTNTDFLFPGGTFPADEEG